MTPNTYTPSLFYLYTFLILNVLQSPSLKPSKVWHSPKTLTNVESACMKSVPSSSTRGSIRSEVAEEAACRCNAELFWSTKRRPGQAPPAGHAAAALCCCWRNGTRKPLRTAFIVVSIVCIPVPAAGELCASSFDIRMGTVLAMAVTISGRCGHGTGPACVNARR